MRNQDSNNMVIDAFSKTLLPCSVFCI